MSSARLPRHPAVAYLFFVRRYQGMKRWFTRNVGQALWILLFAVTLMLQGAAIARTPAIDYNKRGAAKQIKGDLDSAIADYTRALELNSKSATAYYNRGLAKQAKGDLDGAIVDYTRALQLNPKDVEAYNVRGVVEHAKGQNDKAIAD